MNSPKDDDIDMSDVKIELETDDLESSETKVKVKTKTPVENEAVTPIQDRIGRPLWVQTRMCYCPDDAATDCRFHSSDEPGWEVCPNLELSKKNRHVKGRWLWGRNPEYGRANAVVTAEEQTA